MKDVGLGQAAQDAKRDPEERWLVEGQARCVQFWSERMVLAHDFSLAWSSPKRSHPDFVFWASSRSNWHNYKPEFPFQPDL